MANKTLEEKGISKIAYQDMDIKQKESYNFHKVTLLLAEYGFSCYPLKNDWQNADFVAYDTEKNERFFVQQKSRLTIDKKYEGKNLMICFPLAENSEKWVFIPYDELLAILKKIDVPYFTTDSWRNNGWYSIFPVSSNVEDALKPYMLS